MEDDVVEEQLNNLHELTEDIEDHLGDIYDIIDVLEEQLTERK